METKDIFEFGPFRADWRRKSLTRNGATIPLPAKAFDVLHALSRRPGQTVNKDDLMKEVWSDTFVKEGNLTQMVFLLRKALEETEGGPPLIVTVPRQGYRFVGDLTGPAGSVTAPAPAKARFSNKWWIAAGIALVSGFSGWAISRYKVRDRPQESPVVRYTIAPPENTKYRAARVSPDGRSLALVGVDSEGKGRLWVRRVDSLTTQLLGGAEFWPFWSPDSRFIAFAQDGKLKKVEAAGGTPQTICDAPLVVGGSWNRDGTIIFSDGGVISLVPAKGGESKPLTRLDASRGESTHDFPFFLRDGRHFLYTIHSGKKENGGVYVASLDAPDARLRLLGDISNAEYASASPPGTGYLLFVRSGALMAQRFSDHELQLRDRHKINRTVMHGVERSCSSTLHETRRELV